MRHFEIFDPFGEGRAVETLLRPWELGVEAAEPITAAGLAAYGAYEGIKAGWRKYKERQFWRGLKYGYGNPNVSRKLFDNTSLPDPSDPSLPSSIHGMDPMPRDGGSWYSTRARRVGRRKPIAPGKITRALTEMQTFKLGSVQDASVGVTSTTSTAKVGLYGEWDPGNPCLMNLENTVEDIRLIGENPLVTHYAPMHLYDLSWAPVKTNRGASGVEAVDHYDVGTNLNPENYSHAFTWDGIVNNWKAYNSIGGFLFFGRPMHKSTDDDAHTTYTTNTTANMWDKERSAGSIRWIEMSHKNGPPSFSETYGNKVYNKSLNVKFNIAGCRSSPTKVDIRLIKITTPWMHPNYAREYGARGTEEESYYQAEWSRMIRGMCINPIARGDLPQPIPGMKHKWFKTLAKKVVNFPEASADRGTIPMISGSFHVNINQLQDHAWKTSGRGEPQGATDLQKADAYDSVPSVATLDYPTYTMSQKPWFTNRIVLLIRAVNPHQFRFYRNIDGSGNETLDTSINQVDEMEGNGQRYETGNPADGAAAPDGDLNNDGASNWLDYNEYLKNFCPSYDLSITKSFVSINDYMGLPGGGATTSAH